MTYVTKPLHVKILTDVLIVTQITILIQLKLNVLPVLQDILSMSNSKMVVEMKPGLYVTTMPEKSIMTILVLVNYLSIVTIIN
jgi:hypothetical protein